ncbi:hypothetical protein GCM10009681_06740 [Luedemannella helvata]|uniref:Acyl-CoA dehydrogenase n=1 Tax=Luedemannella helvata TaxID=349315 RepID=A0ABN2JTN0_9ACTN
MAAAGPTFEELADRAAELAQLRASADAVLARAWSASAARDLLDTAGPAYEPALWTTVVELGWPEVMVDADAGGGGAGVRELCVLSEACGYAAAGLPLAATAAAMWAEGGCADGIAVVLPQPGQLAAGAVSGSWPAVAYAQVAARLLVLGDDAGTPVLCAVSASAPGVRRTPVVPIDHNPAANVEFDGAPCTLLAEGEEAVRRHREAVRRMMLGEIAELVGVAAAANAAAVDYAGTRVAFGKPIGTFQAVKHRLVDQRADIEVGRALVARAADAVDRARPDAAAIASLAAFWALDRLVHVPEGAVQVFGGIGYTWEHQAHVHLRRAARLAMSLGGRAAHRGVAAGWLHGLLAGERA